MVALQSSTQSLPYTLRRVARHLYQQTGHSRSLQSFCGSVHRVHRHVVSILPQHSHFHSVDRT